MSILPNFFETVSYTFSISPDLETSDWIARLSLPSSFTASSRVFWLRPVIATFAPSSFRRCALARPIPLFPPVITATFPCKRFIIPPLNAAPEPGSGQIWFWQLRQLDEHLIVWLQN